jgi:hypothetical protein
MDILRVTNQNNGKAMVIDVNDKLTLKNLMKRRRQKVIELIRLFQKTYNSHGIVVSLLSTKRRFNRSQTGLGMQTNHYNDLMDEDQME